MIQDFIDRYMQAKDKVELSFKVAHPGSYGAIVKRVLEAISSEDEYDYPDPTAIHELTFGSYQGELLFIVPNRSGWPTDYWFVRVAYGSCSGCDTLEAIRMLDDYETGTPTTEQVRDYMTLALHIVQGIKELPQS